MTDLKYAILKSLYNSPRRETEQKTLYDNNEHPPAKVYSAIKDLAASGLIKRDSGSNKYILTTLGAELYEQEEDARKQKAKQKTQYIISVVLTILTLLSTIFLSEPFIKLIAWLTAEKG